MMVLMTILHHQIMGYGAVQLATGCHQSTTDLIKHLLLFWLSLCLAKAYGLWSFWLSKIITRNIFNRIQAKCKFIFLLYLCRGFLKYFMDWLVIMCRFMGLKENHGWLLWDLFSFLVCFSLFLLFQEIR